MKKGFFSLILSVILVTLLCAGLVPAEQKVKKDKVPIIVVEKKEKNRPDNNSETKKSRRADQ